jgi:hypothetical protein
VGAFYRFEASGNIMEHYSDGNLVNQHTSHGREAAAPKSLYVWGPNIPADIRHGTDGIRWKADARAPGC